MDIKDTVKRLCRKYKTRSPYELVQSLGIILQYGEKMDNVRGFYLYANRIKLICLGNNLPYHIERFVLSHEIGHAVMHRKSSAPFLQSTFFSIDKLEIEANKFAAELVISDETIMEHPDYTINQWAMFYGLPEEIIQLRFKGY